MVFWTISNGIIVFRVGERGEEREEERERERVQEEIDPTF